MNYKHLKNLGLALFLSGAVILNPADAEAQTTPSSPSNKPLKIAVVSFKTCVEQSKMGKHEQSTFESMKKQMESVLEEKEKALNEMATKFNDPDYLDSLSPEAETELKRKFRAQSQEMSGYQNQYMQILQQTNMRVIQKLTEATSEASKKYAQDNKIDLILNEESFYFSPELDISKEVIALLDKQFEQQANEQKEGTPSLSAPKTN